MIDCATTSARDLGRAVLAEAPRLLRIDHDPDRGAWITCEIGDAVFVVLERAREPCDESCARIVLSRRGAV